LADYHEKGKAKGQREKPVPELIYPSQIPNRLAREMFLVANLRRDKFFC